MELFVSENVCQQNKLNDNDQADLYIYSLLLSLLLFCFTVIWVKPIQFIRTAKQANNSNTSMTNIITLLLVHCDVHHCNKPGVSPRSLFKGRFSRQTTVPQLVILLMIRCGLYSSDKKRKVCGCNI